MDAEPPSMAVPPEQPDPSGYNGAFPFETAPTRGRGEGVGDAATAAGCGTAEDCEVAASCAKCLDLVIRMDGIADIITPRKCK